MSDQDGRQVPALQRPSTADAQAWKAYWQAQGQVWRTEPEIDMERQKYLDERRKIAPDIVQGVYPFKEIKLSRADVEWLLAIHESGGICGPVDWQDERQRKREGLDLRGADLCNANLRELPLARLKGGLTSREWFTATNMQLEMAAVLMKGTNLFGTHLEGAHMRNAHVEGASFWWAYLERAHFRGAHLEGANLSDAHLEKVRFENVILVDEKHIGPLVCDAHWEDTNLAVMQWSQVKMLGDEKKARCKKQDGMEKDKVARLKEYRQALRANRQLAIALQAQGLNEEAAYFSYHAQVLQKSVWWFQMTQQKIPFRQWMHMLGGWLFSWLLFLLAGYGYRPGRSVWWYLSTIAVFALGYYAFGHLPLWPPDAFVYSLTSFHGRGFFPGLEGKHSLHDPLILFAAIEAIVGLIIEASFVATFTQRFFGK